MNRHFIVETGGHSFLRKLRNCLQGLDEEIEKLETITKDVDGKNLPRSYFQRETLLLNNVDKTLLEAEDLHSEIIDEKINLDSYENRLLNLRERLLRYEEDKKLLSQNYQPFRPKDSRLETDDVTTEELTDDQSIELSEVIDNDYDQMTKCSQKRLNLDDKIDGKSNNNCDNIISQNDSLDVSADNDCSFNILSTARKAAAMSAQKQKQLQNSVKKSARKKSSKIDWAKRDNPMAARAFAIYNRWVKTDHDDNDSDQSIINDQNLQFKEPKNASFERKYLSKLDDQIKLSGNKNRMTPRVANSRMVENSKNLQEYETVEFTPGMTTRVRKSTEKRHT
ncbi:uncharacterized protein LOC124500228 [Dermatophagoides farinae]|uniref:uncharacterized protein LOC124500228 n=1 Tax=Dermatophagoides farinae TaxID=6954 RepID=UPI003F62893B